MEINYKNVKVPVVRWTIDNFFGHVNNRTDHLDSEKFVLDGLSTKFYLQVYLSNSWSNYLSYYLRVADMAGEKPIKMDYKFWLENDKGEKCAETPGKLL
jgi:hypothetical protein